MPGGSKYCSRRRTARIRPGDSQNGLIHFPRLGELSGVLVQDAGAEKRMYVLGILPQGFLEVSFGGDVIALSQIGDAELGLVINLERA